MGAGRLLSSMREDFFDLTQSLNSWRFWQTILMMALGLTLLSIGINGILVPNKFMGSGVTGIALIIFYLLGKPSLGLLVWLLNLPILLIGWRTMSLKYVVLALMGVVLSGAALDLTHSVRIPTTDPLMAAVMAGVLTGSGVGLYLRFGGSAGGLDIVAAVLRKRFGVPMGTTFMAVNGFIFVVGGFINHRMDIAFYTAVAMTVHARMIERVQAGLHPRKSVLIVTGNPDAIAEQIMRRLGRGVTFLHGSGGMSQKTTRIVYTVTNTIELARLKEIIFNCDSKAFVAISDASEVIGHRFVSWADVGFEQRRRQVASTAPWATAGPATAAATAAVTAAAATTPLPLAAPTGRTPRTTTPEGEES